MTFQELFITNLKDFRKSRKISQAKLAEICESSQAYIAEIEVGKKFPSPDMIEKIASALEVESYSLFQNNITTDIRILTPLQRQVIISKMHEAASKIINQY
jgi:transcriptional regulator with XRE-family HTH domain